MDAVAELDAVTKTYGSTVALDDVSIAVGGGITAVLGPNGAGKSTMISLLAGLRRPTSGKVTVLDGDPRSLPVRGRLGLTPQQTALPWRLTVLETLSLVAAHYPGVHPPYPVIEQLNLGGLLDKRNGTLSGGQRRRVALATALVNEPALLFLDEPTTGLDVDSRDGLWEAITGFAGAGRTVILTTHDMAEAERLAQRVIVIDEGRVARTGSVDEVRAEVGLHLVAFNLPGGAAPDLNGAPVERIDTIGELTRIFTTDPDAVVRELVHRSVPFQGIRVDRVSLEDAIRTIVGPNGAGEASLMEPRAALDGVV